MPVYRRDTVHGSPPWVEVEDFEVILLDHRESTHLCEPTHAREHVVCLAGEIVAESAFGRVTLKKKDWIDVPPSGLRVTSVQARAETGSREYTSLTAYAEVLWVAGRWPSTTHLSMFRRYPGHPLETHYHDYDEYWFMFRGSCTAIYDGDEVALRPGDLLATGMGVEHGIPHPDEVVEGVGLQTRVEGLRRLGHLHRDKDGIPVPQR